MTWNLTTDRPIYLQLTEQLTRRIVQGAYAPGSRLPSVRELAAESGVNPNTMQRALAELEASGLAATNRTTGRIITEDPMKIEQVRAALAGEQISAFVAGMRELGYDLAATIALLQKEGNAQ